MSLFLAGLGLVGSSGLESLGLGIMIFLLVLFGGVYIYTSLAYKGIADKNRKTDSGIAWNPIIGPLFVAFRSSDMPGWPWLLLAVPVVLLVIIQSLLNKMVLSLSTSGLGSIIVLAVIGGISLLIFLIEVLVWHWKMFKSVRKPGWWAIAPGILYLISIIFLVLATLSSSTGLMGISIFILIASLILGFVFIGIAAWSGQSSSPEVNQVPMQNVPQMQ